MPSCVLSSGSRGTSDSLNSCFPHSDSSSSICQLNVHKSGIFSLNRTHHYCNSFYRRADLMMFQG